MFTSLWNFKIQILPVVIALLICELPGITRWFRKLPYIPIYFSIFPLNMLNRELSIYLGEDRFYGDTDISEDEIKLQRNRIKNHATVSMALSVTVPPFIGGFISAFILPLDSFLGFCIVFVLYKLIGMTEAGIDFVKGTLFNRKTMILFIIVYIVYFVLFLDVFGTTYYWAKPFVSKGNFLAIFKDINVLLLTFIISLLIMGPLARYFAATITDKKLRDQNEE